MSKLILSGQRVWAGEQRVSSQISGLTLTYEADAKEATTLEDDTRIMLGGLKATQLQFNGYVDYSAADADMFNDVGVSDVPVSIAAINATAGSVGYFFHSLIGEYNTSGSVGETFAFSLSAAGRQVPVRGIMIFNGDITASGNSTAFQIGAVSAGQSVYAQLHVTSVTGGAPTLDIDIERDDDSGFASPTAVTSFTQATAATSEQISDATVSTDDWYRATFTTDGGSTFTAAIFIGVR